MGLFWLATFGMIALLTIICISVALGSRDIRSIGDTPPVDELDHKIELRAAKWAGFVMALAVLSWILLTMYGLPIFGRLEVDASEPTSVDAYRISIETALRTVQWLFAGFVFANAIYYAGFDIGYRRMACE